LLRHLSRKQRYEIFPCADDLGSEGREVTVIGAVVDERDQERH